MSNETTAHVQLGNSRDSLTRPYAPVITFKTVPAKKLWSLFTIMLLISGTVLLFLNTAYTYAGILMIAAGFGLILFRFFYSMFTIDFDISGLVITQDEIMKDLDW
jgi:hypothetical protein